MVSEAQNPGTSRRGGLFDSLKVLTATWIAIAHTRLELLSTELEEERVRFSSMLVWTLVALFRGGLGVVLARLFVVLALWHTHRLLALGVPAILFILGASASQIFSSRGTVGLLRPPGLWLLHRFSSPCAGHCLLNTRPPQLARELQSEGFTMNDL